MSLTLVMRMAALLAAAPGGAPAAPSPAPAANQAAPPVVHVMDEKERVDLEQTDNVRLSLPTQADVDAWASPGLRVQLGGGYGIVQGSGPALSWRSRTALLRPSVRIDRNWGLGVTLLYGTGPNGVRWSATLEPTFYPWRQLAISAGVGYGGLSINNPDASTGRLQGANQEVSRELTDGERLNSCTGSALSTVLRAEYLFVAGSLFASGPFVQANAQWTHCGESFGRTDTETGAPVVLTQWWQQQGATFGWWFAWR